MTKYISKRGPSRCSRWHANNECSVLNTQSRELTDSEQAYHELEPCGVCVEGETPNSHSKQNWKYQELLDQ